MVTTDSAGVAGVVSDWILANHGNFVSHAIFKPESAEDILRKGYLSCAEDVLRADGTIEYEQGYGYGMRGEERFPSLSKEEIQALKEIEGRFPAIPARIPGYPIGFGMNISRRTYTDEFAYLCDLHVEPPTDAPSPYVGCKVEKLGSIVAGEFSRKLDQIAIAHGCRASTVAIAYDQSKPADQRIDVLLAKAFTAFAEDIKKAKYIKKQVNDAFTEARHSVIYPTKLNFEIRTFKNAIGWDYGNVAILSGRTKQIIGTKLRAERCLLAPWQNNGEFFRLRLADPSALVLGPKALLEKQADSLKARNIKFQYLENLTESERQYFNVHASKFR